MKISFKSINNFLIIFLMLAIVAPTNIAKFLIFIIFFLITIKVLIFNTISLGFSKLIILAFLAPGMILTAINSPQDLIRFSVILILIFGFPFKKFQFNEKIIINISSLILIYLIFTQIFISYGTDWLISFRNSWYIHENPEYFEYHNFINPNKNESLLEAIGKYRLGGLFYNPNVLGLIVLFYFFIFYECYSKLENKKKLIYLFITSITFFSLLLTFSRTAIIGFLIYFFIKKVSIKELLFLRIKKKSVLTLLFAIFMVFYYSSHLLEGLSSLGSGGIKFKILIDYLKSADLISIIFGGQHDTEYRAFDADLGNWIGAVGFIGIVGIILLFRRIVTFNKNTLPLIVALTFMSIGNTALYGLLTANLLLCYFLIVSDKKIKN